MAQVTLTTPVTEADIRQLHVGDVVYIDGLIYGIRDATQRRIFDEGVEPPVDLTGAICLHTAPNVKKDGDRFLPVCIGTTTSTRMERFTPPLIERYGVRGIIGKGGLLEGSMRAMQQFGACYLAIVGGAAALETTQIEAIEAVHWLDLMPECIWTLRVRGLGPLTVAMDSHGGNLYAQVRSDAARRMQDVYKELGLT
ncbi:MAG TPA: FumA C-terminus/TtdB family hydratase beta subunit [Vicinamibacterales bacterium]|nr:FumA C-terminus/TtdB family hydratase beta subunit [Vicinamibacterales bacterium]